MDVLPGIAASNEQCEATAQLSPLTPKLTAKAEVSNMTQQFNRFLSLKLKCLGVQTLRGVKSLAPGSLL